MTRPMLDPVEGSAAVSATPAHAARGRRRVRRWVGAARQAPIESRVGVAVAIGCGIFVLLQLRPDLILARTTPAGGDMGAHVWGPAYLRDSLLPNLRLTGWTPDWYAGFPAFQFYMLPPALLILLLDVVLPYGIAFKLVTVLGVVAMPICAYVMGRLFRLPSPGPTLLSVATVVFLFDRTWTIYGGNIASTLAGEYSFSISLSLALLFFGVLERALETGRHRGLATLLLALVILCHAIPAFFALAGGSLLVLLRIGWRRIRFAAPILVLGCLLTAFWSVPFVLRRGLLTDMGWEKLEGTKEWLLPDSTRWVFALAVVGVLMSLAFRVRLGVFFGLLGILAAVGFWADAAAPVHIWNARLLPFYYLALYLLAAVGVSEVIRSVAMVLSAPNGARGTGVQLAGVGLATAAALITVALPLRALPFGQLKDGTYRWLFLQTRDDSFVDSWAAWNYSGYEGKDSYPEYWALMTTMQRLGATEGCGRAHWEYQSELNRYGTPMALMLLPFWTRGCIGSMEGLYFESSATTPFHFLTAAETSAAPSNPVRSTPERPMPYSPFDLDKGIAHMQLTGVRYYMAFSVQAITAADARPELREVAASAPWKIYEVSGSELVQPLTNEPAVLRGMSNDNPAWQRDAVAWYTDPAALDVVVAPAGPDGWQRVDRGQRPVRRRLPPTRVSNIREDDLSVSFDVDRIGQPVLVKTSYFPNWTVSGADGPYRVTPNFMVVIPRDKHVELNYGYTDVDRLGWGLTLGGLVALLVLVRLGPVTLPPPRQRTGRHLRLDGNASGDDQAFWNGAEDPAWSGGAADLPGAAGLSDAAQGAAQAPEARERAKDAPGDGGPGGPQLGDPHGDLRDDDPGPLRS